MSTIIEIVSLNGYPGPQGPQGEVGNTGAPGPQGPIGATGPAGANGTNGTNGINGTKIYSGTAAPSSDTGVTGDFYIRTSTGDMYEKTDSTTWTVRINLVGPGGGGGGGGAFIIDQGAAEPASVNGGLLIIRHFNASSDGYSLEFKKGNGTTWSGVGSVYTIPNPTGATSGYFLKTDGTTASWASVPAGPTGATGPAGTNGTNGKSAFQVAVDFGFAGNENAWLASLVGPQGPQGATGPAGTNGTNAGVVDAPAITVASSTASAEVKALCRYVCDGTDDQVEINLALAEASRAADGFGGTGMGVVELVGPRFNIANNNTTPILMYPNTWLRGSGFNTIITPRWASSTVDRGCIELLNVNTAHVRVSDLMIGRPDAAVSNGHGIKFTNNADADTYEVFTGSDPYILIDNVCVNVVSRSGIYLTGSNGGCRESQIRDCLVWSAGERGFYLDSSDCQISDCRATAGGNFARFELAGGNIKVANCKAYYSGLRVGAGNTAHGFLVSSSRISLVGCDAQDNGAYGFYVTGDKTTMSGCVADSNSRMSGNAAGFGIYADGVYEGLNAYNRGQTASSPQQTAIAFLGSNQVFVTGRTDIDLTNAGAAHTTGSPGPNSYVRLMRKGTTVYAVG